MLWKLLSWLCKTELRRHVDSEYARRSDERSLNRMFKNYPIGQRVIIRSNEPEDLIVAKVIDYVPCHNGQTFLKLQNLDSGEQLMNFDTSPPYWTAEREIALRKLNWAEQWNVMTKFIDISLEEQHRKESAEYQNR